MRKNMFHNFNTLFSLWRLRISSSSFHLIQSTLQRQENEVHANFSFFNFQVCCPGINAQWRLSYRGNMEATFAGSSRCSSVIFRHATDGCLLISSAFHFILQDGWWMELELSTGLRKILQCRWRSKLLEIRMFIDYSVKVLVELSAKRGPY